MSSRSLLSPTSPDLARPGLAISYDGTRIHYDLYEHPDAPMVVLIIPGFWRHRRHPAMIHFATLLNRWGYAAAVMDVRGHGESGGTYGFNLHEHNDVAAVVSQLAAGDTPRKVSLAGFSYGGSIAVAAAARHGMPLHSLVLISPVADFGMISPRLNPFAIRKHIALRLALTPPRCDWIRVRRSEKLRAIDDIPRVRVPICLIHVQDDWLIGHAHSQALYERAGQPKELHLLEIEGNYHADRIFSEAGETIEPIIERFLARWPAR